MGAAFPLGYFLRLSALADVASLQGKVKDLESFLGDFRQPVRLPCTPPCSCPSPLHPTSPRCDPHLNKERYHRPSNRLQTQSLPH